MRAFRVGAAGALLMIAAGCSANATAGTGSSYVILDSIAAASGATPDEFGGTLPSDVLTFVKKEINGQQVRVPTVFEDIAQVTFRLGMKDPGTPTQPTVPMPVNFITMTRYRVSFIRADGRNTPGVDVPYGYDGAFTVTVRDSPVSVSMTLVRVQAKEESPLRALVGNGGAMVISTIAEITFYGQDQSGRAVTVTGRLSVNFADWGDPE